MLGRQVFAFPSSVEELKPNPKVEKKLVAGYQPEMASVSLSSNSDQQQSNHRTTVFL